MEMRELSVHKIQWTSLHHEGIAFRVAKTFYLEVNVKVGPLNGSCS